MLQRAVLFMMADVSDMLPASIIRGMMEAVSGSETSVSFGETRRRSVPEGICLQKLIYSI
jgi:hypothetical protein